jgi:hypothetical protein
VLQRIGALVGGLLLLLVIGPGLLFAAAWAMRYLSTAIGWGFIVAVAVTEVVLVIWGPALGHPAAPRARVCERHARVSASTRLRIVCPARTPAGIPAAPLPRLQRS